jgi:hypothetical protein
MPTLGFHRERKLIDRQDLNAELDQLAEDSRSSQSGLGRSSAESNPELRDPVTAILISNASAKTGGNPGGAIGRRWPA